MNWYDILIYKKNQKIIKDIKMTVKSNKISNLARQHRLKNFHKNIDIEHNIEVNITEIYRDILCGINNDNDITKFGRNNIKLYSRISCHKKFCFSTKESLKNQAIKYLLPSLFKATLMISSLLQVKIRV